MVDDVRRVEIEGQVRPRSEERLDRVPKGGGQDPGLDAGAAEVARLNGHRQTSCHPILLRREGARYSVFNELVTCWTRDRKRIAVTSRMWEVCTDVIHACHRRDVPVGGIARASDARGWPATAHPAGRCRPGFRAPAWSSAGGKTTTSTRSTASGRPIRSGRWATPGGRMTTRSTSSITSGTRRSRSRGRVRELLALTSRWHGSLLDRHRPLWETHVIEGMADGRIAIYNKVHHSMIDGVSALRITQRSLSEDPGQSRLPAAVGDPARRRERRCPRRRRSTRSPRTEPVRPASRPSARPPAMS